MSKVVISLYSRLHASHIFNQRFIALYVPNEPKRKYENEKKEQRENMNALLPAMRSSVII